MAKVKITYEAHGFDAKGNEKKDLETWTETRDENDWMIGYYKENTDKYKNLKIIGEIEEETYICVTENNMQRYHSNFKLTHKLKELQNMVTVETTKVVQPANKVLGTKEKTLYYVIIKKGDKSKSINIGEGTHNALEELLKK